MSSLVNKVKEALHSDKHSEGNNNNRVESDVAGSRPMGATSGVQGENYNSGAPEGTYGKHNSRLANAADPRVDSDNDGSRTMGSTGQYGNTGSNTLGSTGRDEFGIGRNEFGATGGDNFGTAGTTGQYGGENFNNRGAPEGTFGPHSSRMANAADPRVDSDRDGSRTTGQYGNTGNTGDNFNTTGRNEFGTGRDEFGTGRDEFGTGRNEFGAGTGPAPNTAGPHRSDMLNKIDPRVDSDMDGSRTVGDNNNNTYNSEDTFEGQRDPSDASQVPPSVLRKHLGEPSIEHEDDLHNRDGRHRKMSHQDQFRGI